MSIEPRTTPEAAEFYHHFTLELSRWSVSQGIEPGAKAFAYRVPDINRAKVAQMLEADAYPFDTIAQAQDWARLASVQYALDRRDAIAKAEHHPIGYISGETLDNLRRGEFGGPVHQKRIAQHTRPVYVEEGE